MKKIHKLRVRKTRKECSIDEEYWYVLETYCQQMMPYKGYDMEYIFVWKELYCCDNFDRAKKEFDKYLKRNSRKNYYVDEIVLDSEEYTKKETIIDLEHKFKELWKVRDCYTGHLDALKRGYRLDSDKIGELSTKTDSDAIYYYETKMQENAKEIDECSELIELNKK